MTSEKEQTAITNIELVDIEDIVPNGGNSLFLCLSRILIYMAHKNQEFLNAIQTCCSIERTDLKSDINLQKLLRRKLCEYFIENGITYDRGKKKFSLSSEYSNYFNGNIYDFLLQVYQLSINGFSNNNLYKRFALQTISKMLHVKIYFKKANDQWKYLDPTDVNKSTQPKANENVSRLNEEYEKCSKYLNEITFYLQEFRSVNRSTLSSNLIHTNKNVRILLEKKMWLSKFKDNARICMKFSQFNDINELKSYQQPHFCMDSRKIIDFFYSNEGLNLNLFKKIFCVFVDIVPVHLIMNCEIAINKKFSQQTTTHQYSNGINARKSENELEIRTTEDEFLYEKYLKEMEFSPEYNTIGKQFAKFESYGKDKTIQYLNHLWGKNIFNDKLIGEKYASFQALRT